MENSTTLKGVRALGPVELALLDTLWPELLERITRVADQRIACSVGTVTGVAGLGKTPGPCIEPLLVELESAALVSGWKVDRARRRAGDRKIPVVDLSARLHGPDDRRKIRIPRVWLTTGRWARMVCTGEAAIPTTREEVLLTGWPPALRTGDVAEALGCSPGLAVRLMSEGGLAHFRREDGHRVVQRETLELYVHELIRLAEIEWDALQRQGAPATQAPAWTRAREVAR